MSQIIQPTRVFRMNNIRLADPDPAMPPDEVRALYADSYPHLAAATVEGPTISDTNELHFTFAPPPAKTKG